MGAGNLSSRRLCGPQACTSAILQRSTHTHTAEYKLPPVSLMSAPPSARTVDIEGAEQSVVPALVRSNASQLLDVVLWECHYGGKRKCHVLLSMLKAGGVRRVYQEPNGGFADSWRKTIARQEAQEAKLVARGRVSPTPV